MSSKKFLPLNYIENNFKYCDNSYEYLEDIFFIKNLDWNKVKEYLRATEYGAIDVFIDYYFNNLTIKEVIKKHKITIKTFYNMINKIKRIIQKLGGDE
ncbi:MAG: hypothetical protein ACPL1F_06945 [bacterium]|jgi:hypothetical protein